MTFAPCRESDREELAEMMESVEDIPADSIMAGLAWDWSSYGEYLAAIERWPKGLNVGGMVGHCAVRVHAMGERSLSEEPATPEDIDAMCALVDEAIGAGALGFSTSRTLLHRVPDGRPVPGTWAAAEELLAIAGVMGKWNRGVFEAAPRLGEATPTHYLATRAEVDMMADITEASGRPLTFGLAHSFRRDDLYRRVLEFVNERNATGAHVRPQTTARGIGLLFGLSHHTPFDNARSWKRLRMLSLEERLTVLRDPLRRMQLIEDGRDQPGNQVQLRRSVYVLDDDPPRLPPRPREHACCGARCPRAGSAPVEAFIDLSLETDGRVLLNYPFLNQRLDAVEEMLSDPNVVLGLADAGAHVGQIMDASQPTFFLTQWVREQARAAQRCEEAVRRLTIRTPAELFGLTDRGVLRPGAFADVNVIDFEALSLKLPEYVHDFPGGAGRYTPRADGYRATVVNGRVALADGDHTGDLAGVAAPQRQD